MAPRTTGQRHSRGTQRRESVVCRNRRLNKRATRCLPTSCPRSRSSSRIRGLPSVLRSQGGSRESQSASAGSQARARKVSTATTRSTLRDTPTASHGTATGNAAFSESTSSYRLTSGPSRRIRAPARLQPPTPALPKADALQTSKQAALTLPEGCTFEHTQAQNLHDRPRTLVHWLRPSSELLESNWERGAVPGAHSALTV